MQQFLRWNILCNSLTLCQSVCTYLSSCHRILAKNHLLKIFFLSYKYKYFNILKGSWDRNRKSFFKLMEKSSWVTFISIRIKYALSLVLFRTKIIDVWYINLFCENLYFNILRVSKVLLPKLIPGNPLLNMRCNMPSIKLCSHKQP